MSEVKYGILQDDLDSQHLEAHDLPSVERCGCTPNSYPCRSPHCKYKPKASIKDSSLSKVKE